MNPRDYLNQRRKEITAHDFKGEFIHIKLNDGTDLKFADAFHEIKEGYIYIFTEHYGYHFFEEEMTTFLDRSWHVSSIAHDTIIDK